MLGVGTIVAVLALCVPHGHSPRESVRVSRHSLRSSPHKGQLSAVPLAQVLPLPGERALGRLKGLRPGKIGTFGQPPPIQLEFRGDLRENARCRTLHTLAQLARFGFRKLMPTLPVA